jgi:hypothetical protein
MYDRPLPLAREPRSPVRNSVDFRLDFATLPRMALTRRQREIYDFVREFIGENGIAQPGRDRRALLASSVATGTSTSST